GHHGHSHSHRKSREISGDIELSRTAQILLAVVLVPLTVATAAGLLLLWPEGPPPRAEGYRDVERISAEVLDVHACPESFALDFGGQVPENCRSATLDVEDREDDVEAQLPAGTGAPRIETGDRVLLFQVPEAPPSQQWQFMDFDRSRAIYALVAVFAVAVLLLSRWRGLASLASLAVSLLLVIWFVLPNLLVGTPPLIVAVVAAAAIMIIALYLGHGFNAMTSTALVGTLLALALTGVLGAVVTSASQFTGFSDESTKFLAALQGEINYEGLVLAALVIGSLGVLDDVTVTQAAAVWELKAADPTTPRRELFAAAMRIGRAHVAAAVNTLVLAYVSAMLPLLLFLMLISTSFNDALLSDGVAQEVARGLVGSLGIIAAVPLTTLVAVLVAGSGGRYARVR
ncbi:MAG TPA: YibE/F family protein, partial [Nocardioidaceae bacterium]|nr:YibE/F family protein [Nocardioidaceae bacterium]